MAYQEFYDGSSHGLRNSILIPPLSSPLSFFLTGVLVKISQKKRTLGESLKQVVGRKISYRIMYLMFSLRFLVLFPRSFKVRIRTAKNQCAGNSLRNMHFWSKSSKEMLFVVKFPIQLCIWCFVCDFFIQNAFFVKFWPKTGFWGVKTLVKRKAQGGGKGGGVSTLFLKSFLRTSNDKILGMPFWFFSPFFSHWPRLLVTLLDETNKSYSRAVKIYKQQQKQYNIRYGELNWTATNLWESISSCVRLLSF